MSSALLAAYDLDFAYSSGPQILHQVTVELHPGQTVGLVGESGSGKSTLGLVLAGLLDAKTGAVQRSATLTGPAVQVIFQDPYASLNPALTPLRAVTEVFGATQGLSKKKAEAAAADLLGRVGVQADASRRKPSRLSGGQCQRVSIGRALAANPRVLIADEPTSSLDVSVQAEILNLLKELQRERDLAMILISHDLDVIRHMSDVTNVMYQGRIVEAGATEEIYLQPGHEYTRRLLRGVNA